MNEFVCKLPCRRWVNPSEAYEIRGEDGPVPQSIPVPDLRVFSAPAQLGVRGYPRDTGLFTGGIVTASLGGAAMFFRSRP